MKRIDIDLAADYIVMASWLAFLKSKLLLPIEDDEDVSAQELSAILAFRLRRLEAKRGWFKTFDKRQRGCSCF